MRIQLLSVLVTDQNKALKFYTDVLGFRLKTQMDMGEHQWITVVSPEVPDGPEVVLEPMAHDFARTWQRKLYENGIPLTAFQVDDVTAEHARLSKLGVQFSMEPTSMGPVTLAVFDDTVGNRIQIFQMS